MTIAFPRWTHVRASIIIVAWRQQVLLETCLKALSMIGLDSVPFEVIIVLNGASPDVETYVGSNVVGAHVVRSNANLGFAGGNNRGAESARGEYLVFLNDDAVAEPKWLEWLVATADAEPRAGAIGSCVLFPDGTIQESGSLIWDDGSTMPVGRGLEGSSLDWHFVRRVDYTSACSLLVRRTTWTAVGGFDEGYFPAYYEDVDLCLAIRERGEFVLFEPRSRVRHHESSSSDNVFKSFLFRRNQRRLAERWREPLRFHEPAAPWSPPAVTRAIWRGRGCPRRLLVVDDLVPARSLGAGFGRMLDALIELADAGYALSLYPTWKVEPPVDVLASKGVKIVTGDLRAHLAQPDVFYDAIVVSRPHNFARVATVVRECQPWARLVYDAEALYWRRLEKQASLAEVESERDRLVEQAAAMRSQEEQIFRTCDHAVLISTDEASILEQLEGRCPIDVIAPLQPDAIITEKPFWKRRDLGYVAGWLAGPESPNADGLRWFVSEVLPSIRVRLPWIRLRVTGANPPPEVLALADVNVSFEGHVDDLAAFYDEIRIAIAPIRYGAGVKLKTVEALQHGVPVVSTTIGAEGLRTQGLHVMDVTDDACEFADKIVLLLGDRHAWDLRRRAIETLVETWRSVQPSQTWEGVLDRALSRQPRAEFLRA